MPIDKVKIDYILVMPVKSDFDKSNRTLILNSIICFSLPMTSNEEMQTQDLVKLGEIDQALAIYQQMKPDSARVLNIIGALYAEKKGEYDLAINYHLKAFEIQEKV